MKKKFQAAGVVLQAADTARYMMVLRSMEVRAGGTWAGIGGEIDPGETPEEAVIRELEEEAGYTGKIRLEEVHKFDKGYAYFNFIGTVPTEFEPTLNWENDDFVWITKEDILKGVLPLHPELEPIKHLVF